MQERSSGILLHPTSLPGRHGIGDLGQPAYDFVDFLVETGQTIWQVLPLGPTGYGNSPYQATSSFAGNPLLISLDRLIEAGWLMESDLQPVDGFSDDKVNYEAVIPFHLAALDASYERFLCDAPAEAQAAFDRFCEGKAAWLDDYALFAALEEANKDKAWWDWPRDYALVDGESKAKLHSEFADRIAARRYRQWLFYNQWLELRAYANGRGIQLVGDIPIFVSPHSADSWGNRHLFKLDAEGLPTVVAGVPPDYFSETGQRWGNPHYRWDLMAEDGFAWWKARVGVTLEMVDLIRIDHFLGLEAAWEVPASEPTAVHGEWVKGPGVAFFQAMRESFGDELPFIAEDLGLVTDAVVALREQFNLPGMKIVQFAWNEEDKPYDFQPHRIPWNCVAYTGTHDNDTTVGWWNSLNDRLKEVVQGYIGAVVRPARDLIRVTMMTQAGSTVFPLQDVLELDTDARMNYPGTTFGNWEWRFKEADLTPDVREWLYANTRRFERCPWEQMAQEQS